MFHECGGHRWAKQAELSSIVKLHSGKINAWDGKSSGHAPNLPNRVNEYGFATGSWIGSMVGGEGKLPPIPDFTFTPFDRNSSENHRFGRNYHWMVKN